MGKSLSAYLQDVLLQKIIDDAGEIHVCSAEPTTYTQAVTTFSLGGGSAVGKFGSLTNGTSGRRISYTQTTYTGAADQTDTGTHVAVVQTTASGGSDQLLFVTTCTNVSVTTGNNLQFNAFNVELNDTPT